MIHPYRRIRELVQKGTMIRNIMIFFPFGESFAIKYPKGYPISTTRIVVANASLKD